MEHIPAPAAIQHVTPGAAEQHVIAGVIGVGIRPRPDPVISKNPTLPL